MSISYLHCGNFVCIHLLAYQLPRFSAGFYRFKGSSTPDHFQYTVLRKLVEHESGGCNLSVNFFAEPLVGSAFAQLNMFCDECDFYACFKPYEN